MQEEKPEGAYSFGLARTRFFYATASYAQFNLVQHLDLLWEVPKLVPSSLFFNKEWKNWGKSCNNLQPFLSLTGLPHKGLARLHPRALWSVCVCRAGAAAPPGTVSQRCSHCRASTGRRSLSWAAASPGCTRSPRPSWKGRADSHHQPEISLMAPFLPLTALNSWLKPHYILKDYFLHRKRGISYYCLEF